MPGYYMENFGCRATQADAAAIEHQLMAHGLEPAAPDGAELVIVNTCTVTASADSQARQAIRALHQRNPTARILVTGCYAQRAPEELAELDGVRWVVGNAYQHEIAALAAPANGEVAPPSRSSGGFVPLAELQPKPSRASILAGVLPERMPVMVGPAGPRAPGRTQTRPTLKIQDGCNHRCAYCVIPQVRGRSRSLELEHVVREITRLVSAGAREVVLSGIDLGSYGRDLAPRGSLADLLALVLRRTGLERLRLSSLEPMQLAADLIDAIASSDRVAPHFHVPLDSGSDRILRAMHRWYHAELYARRIELVTERMPDAAIGADVIAGFPGETESDHRATVELARRLPFSYLHVFSFSARPGTEAARLPGQVEGGVIRERARELRALAAEKAAEFRSRQNGRVVQALTLKTRHGGSTDALTGNYLTARVPGHWPSNQWLTVRLDSSLDGLIGLPVFPALASS